MEIKDEEVILRKLPPYSTVFAKLDIPISNNSDRIIFTIPKGSLLKKSSDGIKRMTVAYQSNLYRVYYYRLTCDAIRVSKILTE